ncbi:MULTISPECIES: DeoR/GlpR family DNA-binding transcription regulator [Subtercola]|uniref:DeoR/GlpR transcriptional regulator n=1 Tax=Subtercola vilae TaxID=2056433 RepID=A0A4T2C8T9_9MICO|nr:MULTISPECIES: DeoR/GlpR family DNA-binding transcription regulator [Subtercola]MEA9986829.1 DeoR/GlpR family DNA-binding transcription regulator [Subtercola sp. RTI3]TIH40359.1 DeoR/GlpR transcriptional regulator [Subtercola vilae]
MTDPGPDDQLPPAVRRERMLAVIDERGFARVGELGDTFGVSGVTIRADLDLLDRQHLIRRVHGGAVIRSPRLEHEPTFEQSLEASTAEKRLIGQLAASLVRPGQSVLLDVGSTALAVAEALVARDDLSDVVVVTNGLSIALALEPGIPRLSVIVTGGTLRPLQHSLVEPLASSMLQGLHADIAFIGCNGVDLAHGVTNLNLPEADIKRLMLASASRAVVIADTGKLGQVHLGTIGQLSDFDALITGTPETADPALDDLTASLESAGLLVITSPATAATF